MGRLRLSIYSLASSEPIPYGPLVELVFRRTGDDRYCVMPQNHQYSLGCDPDTVPGCTGGECQGEGTCQVQVCDCKYPIRQDCIVTTDRVSPATRKWLA